MRLMPRVTRQSGTPARPKVDRRSNTARLVRGVVTAAYYADTTDGEEPTHEAYQHPGAVTCDVIAWSSSGDAGWFWRVPVMQRGSSVGNADLWVPRPATRTLDGTPLTWVGTEDAAVTVPENTDGEWVLIDFIEGNPQAPIIIGSVQHPRSKRTQNGATPGTVRDPSADGRGADVPDGIERWLSHQGSIARLDREGNVVVDTTRAPLDDSGAPLEDANGDPIVGGHVDIDLAPAATFVVRFEGARQFIMKRVDDAMSLRIFAASHRMAREGDFVTVNGTTSPMWAAWVAAVTAALSTTLPGLQSAATGMKARIDALLTWAETPPPPNNGRPPLVLGEDVPEDLPLPPTAEGPFPFPSDAHEGGPPAVGAQAVGAITSGSSQIRGA